MFNVVCCLVVNKVVYNAEPSVIVFSAGWVETTVLFFAVRGPKFTKLNSPIYRNDRSLQRRLQIDDSLLLPGDIRDQVAAKLSEIAQENT